jgi:hypothetical protein
MVGAETAAGTIIDNDEVTMLLLQMQLRKKI